MSVSRCARISARDVPGMRDMSITLIVRDSLAPSTSGVARKHARIATFPLHQRWHLPLLPPCNHLAQDAKRRLHDTSLDHRKLLALRQLPAPTRRRAVLEQRRGETRHPNWLVCLVSRSAR